MPDFIRPFNGRMGQPLKPRIRRLYEWRQNVFFDARGISRGGLPYYPWYLTMRDGRIAESVAFLNSIAIYELWDRLPPTTPT